MTQPHSIHNNNTAKISLHFKSNPPQQRDRNFFYFAVKNGVINNHTPLV